MAHSRIIRKRNLLIGLFVIFTIVFLNAIGPYTKNQFIVTNGLIPGLFLLSFVCDSKSINEGKNEYLWLVLLFFGGLISIFYLDFNELYVRNLKTFFGATLAAFIPIALNNRKDYTDFFHLAFILSILLQIVIMYTNGNFNFSNFANIVDYRDRFMLNANAYSYFSFFGNFSLFLLYEKHKTKILLIALIALPILFIIISFVTQSRSGILFIILINLIYWLFINSNEKKVKKKQLQRKLIVLILLIGLSFKFVDIYQNSRIKGRVEGTATGEDSRSLLIIHSLEVFARNPILGVGLGQVRLHNGHRHYSHNSFVEILAEQGIVGGITLFILFGIPLKKSWRLYKNKPDDPVRGVLLLFFITFLLYNNLYVFYKYPFSMIYFFLMISIVNKINNNRKMESLIRVKTNSIK